MQVKPPERCKWCGGVEDVTFAICASCLREQGIESKPGRKGKLRGVKEGASLEQRRQQAWN